MAVTILYEKATGKAVPFAHVIDANESLKTGFYVRKNPNVKPEPIKEIETAPVKIPTVMDKRSLKSKIIPKKGIIKK